MCGGLNSCQQILVARFDFKCEVRSAFTYAKTTRERKTRWIDMDRRSFSLAKHVVQGEEAILSNSQ